MINISNPRGLRRARDLGVSKSQEHFPGEADVMGREEGRAFRVRVGILIMWCVQGRVRSRLQWTKDWFAGDRVGERDGSGQGGEEGHGVWIW